MKFRDIPVNFMPLNMNLYENKEGEIRLYLSTATHFKVYDFKNSSMEELKIPGLGEDKLGNPVRGLCISDAFLFAFQSNMDH